MQDRVYLAWNLPNWITVILMAALGYLILAAIIKGLQLGGFKVGSIGSLSGPVSAGGPPGAALIYGGGTAGVSPIMG